MGFSFTGLQLMSQIPPPPPSGGHGMGNNQPGGGVSLNNGLGILLLLCSVYGGYKIYRPTGRLIRVAPPTAQTFSLP
jgi:hypothetical protein